MRLERCVLLTLDDGWLVGESRNTTRCSCPLAGGTMSGMPGWLAGDEHDDADVAPDGLRGGSGGGGGDATSVSALDGVGLAMSTGDECCVTSDRLRAGNGGGTSQPKLSQPPPSAAPGGRLTRPALPERAAVPPKCAD